MGVDVFQSELLLYLESRFCGDFSR